MLRNILTLALLAATAVANPIEPRQRTTVCVLAEGDDGYTIDPFTRPVCVCKCLKSACQTVTGGVYEDYLRCVKTPWPSNENPWSYELIVAFGACTGSTRCIG